MKEYKVISPFSERDENGNPTGKKITVGEVVGLDPKEAARLTAARCVVEIETETISPTAIDNRARRGRKPRA